MTPEEQSFQNQIAWFARELKQIKRGKKASIVLSDHNRKQFRKYGILQKNASGRQIGLTQKATQVLNAL